MLPYYHLANLTAGKRLLHAKNANNVIRNSKNKPRQLTRSESAAMMLMKAILLLCLLKLQMNQSRTLPRMTPYSPCPELK
jgi:hypothetical protein